LEIDVLEKKKKKKKNKKKKKEKETTSEKLKINVCKESREGRVQNLNTLGAKEMNDDVEDTGYGNM